MAIVLDKLINLYNFLFAFIVFVNKTYTNYDQKYS